MALLGVLGILPAEGSAELHHQCLLWAMAGMSRRVLWMPARKRSVDNSIEGCMRCTKGPEACCCSA
eukprot:11196887-Lingulodinium_polyedra.AAC.1